jgi:hypothetical protein
LQGEIGYALTRHLELFGTFRYVHADAMGRTPGGEASVRYTPLGPDEFFPSANEFDDYNSWGGELGFRLFFVPRQARFRPYIAISGGASHVDNIDVSAFVDVSLFGLSRDQPILRTNFFAASWIGTGSAQLGLDVNLTRRWTLGVNGGVRYESPLEGRKHDLSRDGNNNPFGEIDSGDRWTIPITAYAKFRF